VDSFWLTVRNGEDLLGERKFEELGQFVLDVLVFPHSSASCERVFSKINLVKTKNRTELTISTMNGLLLASQCVSSTGCNKFQPTERMISSMTKASLYTPSTSSSTSNVVLNGNDEGEEDIIFEEMAI